MKKWIAALLAMLLVIGLLAGCSSKDEDEDEPSKKPSKKETTSATEPTEEPDDPEDPTTPTKKPSGSTADGVAIGTILDQPEVVFGEEEMDNFYYKAELESSGETIEIEIALKDMNADTLIYYMSMSAKSNYLAFVVEVGENGDFAVYEREDAKGDFVETTDDYTAEEAQGILEEMFNIVETCIERDWSDYQLKKIKSASSKVYTYEVLEDGEVIGSVSVNKNDGMIMEMEDTVDDIVVTVKSYSLTKHNIPSYK